MKDRIIRVFRRVCDRHSFVEKNASRLYIVDRADSTNGDVEIMKVEDATVKAVCLTNENNIEVFFDGFKKNALPITRSQYSKQCECVLLPREAATDEWMLFIEMKYAADLERAKRLEADYPCKMVKQIKATVQYFREKGIMDAQKRVHAIVSFPNLMDEFSSWTFPLVHQDGTEETVLDILQNDNILIRATNHAKIVNEKVLLLLS